MPVVIADTSALFAGITDTHTFGTRIRQILARAEDPPAVSPLVLAELDYLVSTRVGVAASLSVIDELTSGAYDIATVDSDDIRAARQVVAKYADADIGLTDAVNVVLAKRYGTIMMLTLDHRHFRTIVPLGTEHEAFRLLPQDE